MHERHNGKQPGGPSTRRFQFNFPGAKALQFRDYRLYWFGYMTEVSGHQMFYVAQFWLIYELSDSAVLLGVSGLARAVPATLLTLLGGAVADKLDQRKLLITVELLLMGLLFTLGMLTVTAVVEVWHVMAIILATSAVQAFGDPARQAIFARLIPQNSLMDAVALNATVHPSTRFFGPAIGGLLMAQIAVWADAPLAGAGAMFFVTAAGYLANGSMIYLIRVRAVESNRKRTSMLQDMGNGISYIMQNPIFGFLIGMTYCCQFFGWSFQSLFPVFARDVFGGGEFELGLMYSALGGGSLVGVMVASNLTNVRKRGLLISTGFLAQAILIGLMAISPFYALALGMLLLVGASQSIFNVAAQGTVQYLVPNEYRGRVMGIWGMTHTSIQPLGQLQMGAVAGAVSAPFAVVVGAVAMVLFSIVVVFPNKRLRGLTLEPPEWSEDAPRVLGQRSLGHLPRSDPSVGAGAPESTSG